MGVISFAVDDEEKAVFIVNITNAGNLAKPNAASVTIKASSSVTGSTIKLPSGVTIVLPPFEIMSVSASIISP